jgi:predicted RNA-binding Zn-ribbon protein involved in translation (DUF1610 family)
MSKIICPKCGSQFIAKRFDKNGFIYHVCLSCNWEIK